VRQAATFKDFALFANALSYDPESGQFTWLVQSGRSKVGAIAGAIGSHGYIAITYKGQKVLAHRLAWWWKNGGPVNGFVDHVNCNRLDNRLGNLRLVDRSTNNENIREAKGHNKLGVLGVHYCKSTGKYRASLKCRGKFIELGRHETAEKAHQVYLAAKRKMHEGCTI
jgi:hypothetical protein